MGTASLFLSLAIGAVGTGYFIYGVKQRRPPPLIGGIVLSAYPYFVSNPWVMLGIAAAVILAVWGAIRAGL
jgi:hypothetical protein